MPARTGMSAPERCPAAAMPRGSYALFDRGLAGFTKAVLQ
jgi:hypothetical protein